MPSAAAPASSADRLTAAEKSSANPDAPTLQTTQALVHLPQPIYKIENARHTRLTPRVVSRRGLRQGFLVSAANRAGMERAEAEAIERLREPRRPRAIPRHYAVSFVCYVDGHGIW
jgi:hypothetical protein